MIDITKISKTYTVRMLNDEDLDSILKLCQGNTVFNQYWKEEPTKELLQDDMHSLPDGAEINNKYYMGLYKDNLLVAIMSYIDQWPTSDAGCLEFFMVDISFQGKGTGTSMLQEFFDYLKDIGRTRVVFGVVADNPQANNFLAKNGCIYLDSGVVDGFDVNIVGKML